MSELFERYFPEAVHTLPPEILQEVCSYVPSFCLPLQVIREVEIPKLYTADYVLSKPNTTPTEGRVEPGGAYARVVKSATPWSCLVAEREPEADPCCCTPDPNNNNFWRCGGRVCEDTPCCHKRTTVWKVYPQCIPPKRCSYHTYVCSAPFWETLWLLTEEIGIYD